MEEGGGDRGPAPPAATLRSSRPRPRARVRDRSGIAGIASDWSGEPDPDPKGRGTPKEDPLLSRPSN
jgi:hypothetical protein